MNLTPKSTTEIRFSDCDPFGHLNNARFLDYFLHAREQHLKHEYGMELQEVYKEGLSWLIGSHEIVYLKPAVYGETVHIATTLLRAAEDHLLAEMVMTNEKEGHIKAIMWTKFVPVNIKTGKREVHPPAVMDFVTSLVNKDAVVAGGMQERIGVLLAGMNVGR